LAKDFKYNTKGATGPGSKSNYKLKKKNMGGAKKNVD